MSALEGRSQGHRKGTREPYDVVPGNPHLTIVAYAFITGSLVRERTVVRLTENDASPSPDFVERRAFPTR